MEATATGTRTHIGGSTFSEVGRKTNASDALKTKEGEFSPLHILNQQGVKRRGGLCQLVLGVNDDHDTMLFHKISRNLLVK